MTTIKLTSEEKAVIAALKRLEKTWPKTLWLFAGDGKLGVLKKDADGERVMNHLGCVDQGNKVADIDIECDGGGW